MCMLIINISFLPIKNCRHKAPAMSCVKMEKFVPATGVGLSALLKLKPLKSFNLFLNSF